MVRNMRKFAALVLLFASQVAHAGNYPIPAPGTAGNVMKSVAGKWASGVPRSAEYTTTATAAGTTTLVVTDTYQQYFTGSTTQTVKLPVTSTLALGQSFLIVNLSSGVVTVQSSGANTLQAMAANFYLLATCILTSGTGTASWNWSYAGVQNLAPMTNPMTTGGDVIYGGASGSPTRLANGSAGQLFMAAGGTSAPSWTTTLSAAAGYALHGTNTNDSASTGYVGEYVSISGTGQSFPTSGQYGDCGGTSITIGAGDWDISLVLSANSATTATAGFYAGISTTTGNSSSGLTSGDNFVNEQFNFVTNSGDNSVAIPNYRMSVSGSTIVYCKIESTYTGSPKYDYRMSARRVR